MADRAPKIEASIYCMLRMCSLAAKGLWLELRQLDDVQAGDRTPGTVRYRALANLAGIAPANFRILLEELTAAGLVRKHPTDESLLESVPLAELAAAKAARVARQMRYKERWGGPPETWERTRLRILERDKFTCRYCGAAADTVDHVIPRTRGGTDGEGNLVGCCSGCNTFKGARTPEEAGLRLLDGGNP